MLSNLLYTDPHGQMPIRIQETYLYVDPCGSGSETLGDTRVDTLVSFVQNSREFQAKQVLYLAKKKLIASQNFVFCETGCRLRKPVSNVLYFAKQNVQQSKRNKT